MFCRKCGKEVQEDWATCPNCGNPIHQNATANMAAYTLKGIFMKY